MRTKYLILIAAFLMISTTTVSCNGCEDKNNDPLPTGTPEVSESGSDAASANGEAEAFGSAGSNNSASGTAGSGRISDNEGPTAGSPSTMSTSTNKSRDVSGNKKPAKNLEGYSAPNGTAAENYDGDPYTKHDTTSMPSGTSIR